MIPLNRVPHWKETSRAVIIRDAGKCWLCGGSGADTADHVVPRELGGLDHPSNLRAAHRHCNSRKGIAAPVAPIPSRAW